MNKDLTKEFQDFVNSFQKSNRKGVMTSARISEFNKKFNTYFQIYMPKHRHFQPKKVSEELDWVFYLHKEHFCLIRKNNKTLGIKEIEDNYHENVWRTCGDDDALTCFAQLKLNVISQPHDDTLYAWDCETYSENKAFPYCCTLVNLEKLRKKLELIKRVFQDLKPTDPIPEEFYNKLMTNIVEIFVGTDCFDQMMRRLGTVDEKRLTLISHNGSGFDNWIALQSINKLTQYPLGWYYLYHYDKEMVEEEWYESTRMVTKHTEKENVEKVYSHTHPFIRYFIRQSIKGGRVSANRKSFETNEICAILKEYLELESNNMIDFFKEYSASTKDKTEVHSRLKKIKCTKLMAFDANGLYASAMTEGEYPKAVSARAFLPEENKEFVKLFNEQKFRPRTAILKVWFEYPTNMFFQPIPAKDKITFMNKEGKKETGTKIRFRNGFCSDVLTSVDIQEIVKAGGRIIKILDGIVYQENFKTQLYRDNILILKELRNKYKKEGDLVASNCMKLLGNSLYGKSIQRDRNTSLHLWNEETFRLNYDKHVKKYDKLNETQYIVEINDEEKEFVPPKDFTRLTPTHLGTFILSHSKKIMNNFIHVIDGFYKPEIYYTDTDSLYISSSTWDKLNEAELVSENEYCKGKNDYGDGGIIFGLYLAPKVKYNIILTSDGILKEKKTFKGYSNYKIKVDVTNEFDKPWGKSFTDGIVIPNEKLKTKKFNSYLNLIKRKGIKW
ncbi:hypothetical protein LOTGIDRAFT_172055 [Lottia gigantea]|uniref:DNA-directed DNA polymerase n=1 Tax=Lottia gigantea TaxID=225164 RepID=V4B9Y3_LOTGI|nr:hypothetical protein LOTGIDRAFT_172055 [Lottia gigantea]ESP02397.1 hypothetical protein LOTGIDRAFT_172055 [Lottia gigantea]